MRKVCYLVILFCGCATEKARYTPTYAPFSRSVIHVKFNDDPVDSLSVSAVVATIIPQDGSISNTVIAGNSGDYYLYIETDRPAKSLLMLGNVHYNVFLFPNDTTHINVNITPPEFELSFLGIQKA